jgi:thiol-disulfide isomerase/thioredoxin
MTRTASVLGVVLASCLLGAADEPKEKGIAAAQLRSAGLAQAKKDNKQLFLIFGSPSCSWCRVFEKYHADAAVSGVIGKHLVLVKVDVEENAGGQEMYDEYGKARGVPAFVILDAAGKVLADSGDGDKNIGFPFKPEEVDRYFAVLKATCPKLTDAEVQVLRDKLKEVRPNL